MPTSFPATAPRWRSIPMAMSRSSAGPARQRCMAIHASQRVLDPKTAAHASGDFIEFCATRLFVDHLRRHNHISVGLAAGCFARLEERRRVGFLLATSIHCSHRGNFADHITRHELRHQTAGLRDQYARLPVARGHRHVHGAGFGSERHICRRFERRHGGDQFRRGRSPRRPRRRTCW
jgi:hypothetical protein